MPNEYKSLQTLITRTNKTLGKILFEDIRLSEEIGEERGKILESISTLRISLDQLLDQFSKKPEVIIEDDIVPRLPMPWVMAGYHHVGKGIHLNEECSIEKKDNKSRNVIINHGMRCYIESLESGYDY